MNNDKSLSHSTGNLSLFQLTDFVLNSSSRNCDFKVSRGKKNCEMQSALIVHMCWSFIFNRKRGKKRPSLDERPKSNIEFSGVDSFLRQLKVKHTKTQINRWYYDLFICSSIKFFLNSAGLMQLTRVCKLIDRMLILSVLSGRVARLMLLMSDDQA